ncbi:MAG: hypothetical protein HOE53_04985 [Candidatus Magasanikbacteria bacterium]|jgi:hypothetical protein|nr:hypothetical protein [Candidatus Magasanikbacteria bacterium]
MDELSYGVRLGLFVLACIAILRLGWVALQRMREKRMLDTLNEPDQPPADTSQRDARGRTITDSVEEEILEALKPVIVRLWNHGGDVILGLPWCKGMPGWNKGYLRHLQRKGWFIKITGEIDIDSATTDDDNSKIELWGFIAKLQAKDALTMSILPAEANPQTILAIYGPIATGQQPGDTTIGALHHDTLYMPGSAGAIPGQASPAMMDLNPIKEDD